MRETTLRIRRYVETDHDEMWTLHNSALDAAGAHGGNGPWDEDLHRIEEIYLSDGGEFLVGLLAGELVAMGALKRTSDERAEIKRMRVHPHYQRRGFGRAMLLALERRAVELGYALLHLDTTVKQDGARRLYLQSGYLEVGRGFIGSFDCVFFEKAIERR